MPTPTLPNEPVEVDEPLIDVVFTCNVFADPTTKSNTYSEDCCIYVALPNVVFG